MDIDTMVENHFKKNRDVLGFETLANLIEEVMDSIEGKALPLREMSVKTGEGETIDIKLPTIKFTENWGKPDNADRTRIERYMKNIEGDTLTAKLDSLRAILSGADKTASVGQILSTLILIEILATLAGTGREFTEAAAGFIFEGFLAGLFGGQSVQIVDVEEAEGQVGKPITDVVLHGRSYSLKLLGPRTAVKGSWKNLIGHFESEDEIVYLDARRTEDGGLHFSEFIITLPDYLKIFGDPFKKFSKKVVEIETIDKFRRAIDALPDDKIRALEAKIAGRIHTTDSEDGRPNIQDALQRSDDELEAAQKGKPFKLAYQEEDIGKGKVIQKLYGGAEQYNVVAQAVQTGDKAQIIAALKQTRGYSQKPEQFSLSKKQVSELATYNSLGTIPLGEDALREVWSNYAELLLSTIDPVYRTLQKFTDDVDRFFLGAGEKGGDRKAFGEAAIKDAGDLQVATDSAVQAVTAQTEK